MKDKKEINELMSKLVNTFGLECLAKEGMIGGDELVDRLTEFAYKTTKLSLEERKSAFGATLKPYLEQYGREMLNEFYYHFSATKENGWKMKFERESSWNIGQRLANWHRNSIKFNAVNMVNKLNK